MRVTTGATTVAVNPATMTVLPGLSTTLTLSTADIVYISTDGGIVTAVTKPISVDILLVRDSTTIVAWRRHFILGGVNNNIVNWSFAATLTGLTGSHTFSIAATNVGGEDPTVAAIVGGVPTSPTHGVLNTLILKH
jgi:hypothetical protein